MSLADQSQQWYPTSVQVTVFQAKNLRIKGKHGTNDAYAIMQVAKDKFSTSVAEKCVAPVWKEEATFDLPLFHHGNAERCTLHIIVMHRALVGLDKHLGQAVINLLELHDNKSRKKTDWFKLVDKSGKADKDRGEVLLDIQFMRNNLTASMFDLSMQDKPRSRIAKLKDKVRGKKSDGFSDSASAIVPSVTRGQVLTDSEGEGEDAGQAESPSTKKKSKLKSLFAPKTNLQRNHSQSMSVLGTLPEKNSPLSASRSSGLNVESPDVKRKIGLGKFGLGHKRTGSNDSKVSTGPFSLLGRSKQRAADENSMCINGSHVYNEEAERKTGSTLSLNSSGKGSVEDVRRQQQHERNISDASTDSLKALSIPSYKPETQERKPSVPQIHIQQPPPQQQQQQQQQRLREEEAERERELEAKRQAEEKRRQAESKRIQDMLNRQEEQEKKRMQERQKKVEEEEERRRRREDEERKRGDEQEKLRQEVEEQERKRQEEARRAEEQRQHEETRVTDRLSSLFGLGKKKEEKKEEQHHQQHHDNHPPTATPRRAFKELEIPATTNPFEEISLSPEPPTATNTVPGHVDSQRGVLIPHAPNTGFPSRTPKAAVKPSGRLTQWQDPEPDVGDPPSPIDTTDTDTLKQDQAVSPSPLLSEHPHSSVPSDPYSDTSSSMHSSLAPPNVRGGPSASMRGSRENLADVGSTSERRTRVMLPPGYPPRSDGGQYGLNAPAVTVNGRGSPRDGQQQQQQQQGQRPELPLPDYETLFPKKRHGVMAQGRWDNIIAEVNQRKKEREANMSGPEMSVDGPAAAEEPSSSVVQGAALQRQRVTNVADHHQSHRPQRPEEAQWDRPEARTAAHGGKQALQPSRAAAVAHVAPPQHQQAEKETAVAKLRQSHSPDVVQRGPSPTPRERRSITVERGRPKEAPLPAARSTTPLQSSNADRKSPDVSTNAEKQLPSVRPRLKPPTSKEQTKPTQPEIIPDKGTDGFDPFPSSAFQQRDPWALEEPQADTPHQDDLFTGGSTKREKTMEDLGIIAEDPGQVFELHNPAADPFSHLSQKGTAKAKSVIEPEDKPVEILSEKVRASPEAFSKKRRAPEPPANSPQPTTNNSADKTGSRLSGLIRSNAPKPESKAKIQDFVLSDEEEPMVFSSPSAFKAVSAGANLSSLRAGAGDMAVGPAAGGKAPVRAWVSPSDTQLSATPSSSGGSASSTLRRPHPVRPLSSTESQTPNSSTIAVSRDLKSISINDASQKVKVADSGPYTQLTQEELITLVVKQQAELSKKDEKIVELEEYIDNLLVRVIEEKPSILMALAGTKGPF
ncbi:rab11 family-interacting protein 1 isoform X3 [Engraulis encrasicolus]|uniref:rab11 family-interacting protein 1 isoform X3 n=1 Tax=Engraulis encrasicolus TaxID=184585 RepID=UPI002FD66B8F